MVQIHPFGDRAILINFEQRVDPVVNQQVVSLWSKLKGAAIAGIEYFTPAYCSLTIGFDPGILSIDNLTDLVNGIISQGHDQLNPIPSRTIQIPVCYEAVCAPDLISVSNKTGMEPDHIIELHSSTIFQVYMLGFIPGFAYMGKVPPELRVARRSSPRLKVPSGSIGLAGFQTGIYPSEAPGGWQLIGQTPIPVFDADHEEPFLFQAGDQVKFIPISMDQFSSISHAVKSKEFNRSSLYA